MFLTIYALGFMIAFAVSAAYRQSMLAAVESWERMNLLVWLFALVIAWPVSLGGALLVGFGYLLLLGHKHLGLFLNNTGSRIKNWIEFCSINKE